MDEREKIRSRNRRRSADVVKRLRGASQMLEDVMDGSPDEAEDGTSQQGAGLIRIADRSVQAIEWLWAGRIPLAKCTLLVGDPDAGKSFVTLDLAARVTRGAGLPPEPGLERPGSVLLLSADDHIEDTILPRLQAAGADLERVALLPRTVRGKEGSGIRDRESGEEAGRRSGKGPSSPSRRRGEGEGDGERLLSLATDVDRIERALVELGDCRLVVVDPISAYLRGVDTYNNFSVRQHLLKLSDLAERHRVAIVLVSHQRKAGAPTAMYRAIGSLAFTAVARVVLLVTADATTAGRRLLLPVKMTLQTAATGRAFSIEEGRVAWEAEPVPYTADELALLMRTGEGSIDVVRETVEWLKELLGRRRRVSAEEIQRLAREKSISKGVLWAAKKQACIKAVRDGKEQKWYWERIVPWNHGMVPDETEWELSLRRAGG